MRIGELRKTDLGKPSTPQTTKITRLEVQVV
jgi:hypothetical protein